MGRSPTNVAAWFMVGLFPPYLIIPGGELSLRMSHLDVLVYRADYNVLMDGAIRGDMGGRAALLGKIVDEC